ncbi:uncharacterized protein EI90DRAFT_3060651 [Cantharellus anzutake]|uniref:uncharacterized protein n=1 Tax=Cantharellus anzutake TaxID=1750568 RepID=UPI001903A243|nr:uncharacterized protein EI90DRAFT_3060651 [Cantharellus anzutake]KAF8330408.1 hypothetical protein EI90DRAFT_3060651 [Cantharellus anzutake]
MLLPSAVADLSGQHAAPPIPMNSQYKPLPQPAQSTAPLVLVEGFMSYTSEYFWGDFETHLNAHRARIGSKKRRHIMFARVSPVNSVHDRACELFYLLRGGSVDYGEEHAKKHKHRRFGRHHSIGLYPSWSVEHPLHFIGHSMGGVTVVKMMTLMRDGFFGPDVHSDMVASVTSVGSPFRGTQLTYWMIGMNESGKGHHPISLASLISKFVHAATYFSPILPSSLLPDFCCEARPVSMSEISPVEFLKQLWKSDWSGGKDCIPWDCTFEAAEERDEEYLRTGASLGKTWYRSYVTTFTNRADPVEPYHVPFLRRIASSPPMWLSAFITGGYDFSTIRPVPSFLRRTKPSSSEFPCSPPSPSGSSISSAYDSETESEYFSVDEDSDAETVTGDTPFPTSLAMERILDEDEATEGGELKNPFELGEAYYSNDGVAPVFSLWHPGSCSSEHCIHYPPLSGTARLPVDHLRAKLVPRPGVWNVVTVEDAHHLSLMPLWTGSKKQQTFWYGLGEWLEEVDHARHFFDIMEGKRDTRITSSPSAVHLKKLGKHPIVISN